mmetsp:Transcript_4410/g.10403  ORF Transcript_4410/g.10403 Transcript_4410/m.10403 type:complete len:122 (+) Transcript_4410:70-435(+)
MNCSQCGIYVRGLRGLTQHAQNSHSQLFLANSGNMQFFGAPAQDQEEILHEQPEHDVPEQDHQQHSEGGDSLEGGHSHIQMRRRIRLSRLLIHRTSPSPPCTVIPSISGFGVSWRADAGAV